MPCVQRSWLANLLVVAQLLNFGGLCYGEPPQPGQVRFPDRRQEHVIKGLPEYHVVAPVRVDASGHFLSYGLHHPFTSSRRKRDLGGPEDRVYYRISHEEKDLLFNLTVNQGLLSRSYIVERRYGNLSHIKMVASSAPPCHLKGTVLQQGTRIGTAALSSCHGLISQEDHTGNLCLSMSGQPLRARQKTTLSVGNLDMRQRRIQIPEGLKGAENLNWPGNRGCCLERRVLL
ncbi:A disintegrin and metalloproteinase with thrombospondin motif 12 [Pteropus alecto]|uniref:A disintegrin and metalloproteinase with thrombospondin motif 12 n=1 Tax=Pteropus alecto TaxID=9402 RepID=L5L049_PTEAL|nr:A disintegrin and metalloproteinase with thrombospondin motif 12 [Pteropus alecto]